MRNGVKLALYLILLCMVIAFFGYWRPYGTVDTPATVVHVYTFNDLLDAIAFVESNGNPRAVGDGGKAIGMYQLHEIYVKDVNRLLTLHTNYTGATFFKPGDRWNALKSRQMVLIYTSYYGRGLTVEDMARIHNGGPRGYLKPSTKAYGQKVLRIMETKYETCTLQEPEEAGT